ncbi:MAG: hypothetical protein CL912_06790 [Deltaproteobacteria bacterium]|nr:hypothetical protein [Deltaproteobacteria bacterium]
MEKERTSWQAEQCLGLYYNEYTTCRCIQINLWQQESDCSTLDEIRACEESFSLPAAEEGLPNLPFEQSLSIIL